MSTEFFNDQWRIPSNENQNKVSNYSMECDGTSDFILLDNTQDFLNVDYLSISVWFKPDALGFATLIGNRYFNNGFMSWAVQVRTDGKIRYLQKSPSVGTSFISTNTYNANAWNHVAITYDGTNAKIYLNGGTPVVIAGSGGGGPIQYDSGFINDNVTIGAAPDDNLGNGPSQFFNGKIDQVSIFDYELPATGTNSVATLYGGGTAVVNPLSLSPKPIAAYQLGDQSVSTGANYLVPNNSLSDYVFSFDRADDDFIDVDNSNDDLNIPFGSFAFWFYPTTTTSQEEYLLSCNRTSVGTPKTSWSMNIQNQDIDPSNPNKARINFTADNHGVNNVTAFDVNLNQWNHYIAVKPDATSGNTRPNFYVNGQPSIPSNPTNLGPNFNYSNITTDKVYIGRLAHPSFSGGFNGEMSNIQVFNTALSSLEAQNLYNNGSPLTSMSGFTSLVSWWKLNAADTFDGTNWTIKDYKGSNDGISDNMTSANLVQSDLQHVSGFSPYALTLDASNTQELLLNNGGNAILNGATSFTVSAWINPTDTNIFQNIFSNWAGNILFRFNSSDVLECFINTNTGQSFVQSVAVITYGVWQHIAATYSGSDLKIYRNGVELKTVTATGTINNTNTQDRIGNRPGTTQYFNGKISNVAVWKNSVIDINTLYGQGVPSDLTSLSPSVWWQLGSNCSFNSGIWTCLNEGTLGTDLEPLNATSSLANATNDDIVNGVGYSANGLGTSSIDIVGDAPYSTANGLSENMDVLDRTTDVPT